MSDFFAEVKDGKILKLNIPRTRPYGHTLFGINSTDEEHIKVGLLPIKGSEPEYDRTTHIRSGLKYIIRGKYVERIYTITEIALDDIKASQKELISRAHKQAIKHSHECVCLNLLMDADPMLIKAGFDLAVAMGEESMIIRDFNNKSHTFSIMDAGKIVMELTLNYRDLWLKKVDLQNLIDSKVSPSSVLEILWD